MLKPQSAKVSVTTHASGNVESSVAPINDIVSRTDITCDAKLNLMAQHAKKGIAVADRFAHHCETCYLLIATQAMEVP